MLAYQPAWNAGFIWDDDVYVIRNKLLTAPDGLFRIWFSLDSPSQYCPMVYTTFRIERGIWGLSAAGYHWTNILVHAANALLLWRVLWRLQIRGAWLGAALFALHPVQVESVAWITERKNVLSLFFSLWAVIAWLDILQAEKSRTWKPYLRLLFFYALALLSKTTACTLPAALLLILWLKRRPLDRVRLLQILPLLAIGFAMGSLTMWWERYHQGTAGKLFAFGWLDRLLAASRAIWFYAGKLLWPVNLAFSYPRWNINPRDPSMYVWPAACLAAVFIVWRVRKFAGRGLETSLAFYVLTLAPLLGFIMLYTFRYSFVADHYQYVASIGPFAFIAAGVDVAMSKFWRISSGSAPAPGENRIAATAIGGCKLGGFWTGSAIFVLLLPLAILTWRQCRIYADTETLWRDTIQKNPRSYLAHNNLATTLLRKGDTQEAITEFNNVLKIAPDYEIGHYDLGHAYLRQDRKADALAEFEKAVRLDPTYAKAQNNLANLLVAIGRPREAVPHYDAATRLQPQSADILNNFAWQLATSPDDSVRNGAKAVELATRADSLSHGKDPVYTATLAAAYAESKQFPAAISTARAALEKALLQHDFRLAAVIEKQLHLYEADTPCRDVQ